jgi:GNAT superfamily N-acetyltransferase
MGGSILDQAYEDQRNAELDAELNAMVTDYERRNPPAAPVEPPAAPKAPAADAGAKPTKPATGGLEKLMAADDRREKKSAKPYSNADRWSTLFSGDFKGAFDKAQISRELNRLYAERKANGSAVTREDLISLAESNYAQRNAAIAQIGRDLPKLAESGLQSAGTGLLSATGMFAEIVGDEQQAQELYAAAGQLNEISEKTMPKPDNLELAGVYDGIRSFAMAAPAATISWKTRNPEVLLDFMFGTTAGLANLDALDPVQVKKLGMDDMDDPAKVAAAMEKMSLGERLTYSVAQGLVERTTELLPAHILFGKGPGRSMMRRFFESLATEVPGEQAALAGSKFLEWRALNPTKPVEEYYQNYPQEAYRTFIATITGTVLNNAGVLALDTADAQIGKGLEKLKPKPEDDAAPDGGTPPADGGEAAAEPAPEPSPEPAPEGDKPAAEPMTIAELADSANDFIEKLAEDLQSPETESEDQKFIRSVESALGIKRPAAPVETPEERRARMAERRANETPQPEQSDNAEEIDRIKGEISRLETRRAKEGELEETAAARLAAHYEMLNAAEGRDTVSPQPISVRKGVRDFARGQQNADTIALKAQADRALDRAMQTESSADIAAAVSAYNDYARSVGREQVDPDNPNPRRPEGAPEPISYAEEMDLDDLDRTSTIAEAERIAGELEAMDSEEAKAAASPFRTLIKYAEKYDDNDFWQGFDEALEYAAPHLLTEEQQQAIVEKVAEAVEDAPLPPEEEASAKIIEDVRAEAPASKYFGRKSFGGEGLATEMPAAEAAPVARTSAKYQVETEDAGSFELTIIRLPDGSVGLIGPDINVNYVPAFAKGKTDQELMAYQFEPLGFKQATDNAGRKAEPAPPAPAAAPAPARLPAKPAPISETQLAAITAKEGKTARPVQAREAMLLKAESVYDDILTKEVLEELDDRHDMSVRQVREVMGKAIEGRGSIDRFNTLMKRYAKVRAGLDREAAESGVQADFEALAAAQPDPGEGGLGRGLGSLMAEQGVNPETKFSADFEIPGSPEWEAAKAKGLPMDRRSRELRALDQGFNISQTLYHGTGAQISEFDLNKAGSNMDAGWLGRGVYMTTSKGTAENYSMMGMNVLGEPNVIPLFVRGKLYKFGNKGKALRAELYGEKGLPDDIRQDVLDRAGFTYDPEVEPDPLDERRLARAMTEVLQERGYAGVEASFSFSQDKEVVIFDPSNIRSVHAAFDPDRASSPNLLFSAGTSKRKPVADPEKNRKRLDARAYRDWGQNYLDLVQKGMVTFASAEELEAIGLPGGVNAVTIGGRNGETAETIINTSIVRPEHLEGILLHEVGVHAGLKGLMGAARVEQVLRTLDALVDSFTTKQRAGLKTTHAERSAYVARQKAIRQAAKPEHVREETLAYIVEDHVTNPFVPPFLTQLKVAIGRRFPGIIDRLGWGSAEYAQLALVSLRQFIIKEIKHVPNDRAQPGFRSPRAPFLLQVTYPEGFRKLAKAQGSATTPQGWARRLMTLGQKQMWNVIRTLDLRNVDTFPQQLKDLDKDLHSPEVFDALMHLDPDFNVGTYLQLYDDAMAGDPDAAYELYDILAPLKGLDVPVDVRYSKGFWPRKHADGTQIEFSQVGNTVRVQSEHGDISGHIRNGAMIVSSSFVNPDQRGKGYGTDLYEAMAIEAANRGLIMFSDRNVSLSAARAWRSLSKRGFTVIENFVPATDEVGAGGASPMGMNPFIALPPGIDMSFAEAHATMFPPSMRGQILEMAEDMNKGAVTHKANFEHYKEPPQISDAPINDMANGGRVRSAEELRSIRAEGKKQQEDLSAINRAVRMFSDIETGDRDLIISTMSEVMTDLPLASELNSEYYYPNTFTNLALAVMYKAANQLGPEFGEVAAQAMRAYGSRFSGDDKTFMTQSVEDYLRAVAGKKQAAGPNLEVMFSADFEQSGPPRGSRPPRGRFADMSTGDIARRVGEEAETKGISRDDFDGLSLSSITKADALTSTADARTLLQQIAEKAGEDGIHMEQLQDDFRASQWAGETWGRVEDDGPGSFLRDDIIAVQTSSSAIPRAEFNALFERHYKLGENRRFAAARSDVKFSADFADPAPEVDPALEEVYFNFVRFGDPDTVHPTIREALKTAGVKQRMGPPITLREVEIDAQNTNAFEAMVKSRKGQTLTFAELTALRNMHKYSALKLKELADMANADPSDRSLEAAVMRASMFHQALLAEIRGQSAQAARTLNAMKIQAQATAAIASVVDNMLQDANSTGDLRKMIRDLAQLDPAKHLANLNKRVEMSTWKAWQDLAGTWLRAMYLSMPSTHFVNALGNITTMLGSIADHHVAGRLTFDPDLVEESRVRFDAMMEAFVHQFTYMKANSQLNPLQPNTSINFDAEGVAGVNRWEGQDRALSAARLEKLSGGLVKATPDDPVGKLAEILGYALSAPSEALGVADDLFKGANYRISLRGQAFRQAREERRAGKITDAQEQTRAEELFQWPTEDMVKRAIYEAQENTFTRPVGPMTKTAMSVRSWLNNATGVAGYLLLPFILTPSNLMSFRFRRMPTAPLFKEWRDAYSRGGKDRAVAIAQVTNGTTLLMAGGALFAAGLMTGAGPDDPAKRKALMDTGWKPFALRTPDGSYVETNRLDPLMMPFHISASIFENFANNGWNADPNDDVFELVGMSALKFGQMMTDKTYMAGIANVFEAMASGRGTNPLESWVNRTVAGATTPALLAGLRRQEDPFKRQAFSIIDQIRNRSPVLSESLPKAYDVLGNEVMYQEGFLSAFQLVNPFAVSKMRDEPVYREFERLKYIPDPMDWTITVPFAGNSVGVSLRDRPDIYSDMTRMMGGDDEYGLPNFRNILNDLVTSDYYQQLSDINDPNIKGSKAEAISKMLSRAHSAVKGNAQDPGPLMVKYWPDLQDMARKEFGAQVELGKIKEAENTQSAVTAAYQQLVEEAK